MKNEFKTTDNSTVYRRLRWIYLAEGGKTRNCKCAICPPHKGCNYSHAFKDRSWKRFRKTQHKTVEVSV